jgi:outer membrane protein OmpA-like peptidoglycan-associated protein
MSDPSQPVAPSRPTVFCVLSFEQQTEFVDHFGRFRHPDVGWVFETSPEDALDRIGQLRPGLVFVGMTIGATEGLEFLALLFKRYRDFAGKVVVLPNRDDPFPPVIQSRDPATGRSSTVQTDLEGLGALITAMAPRPEATPRPASKATQIGLGAVPVPSPEVASIKPSPTLAVEATKPEPARAPTEPETPPAEVPPVLEFSSLVPEAAPAAVEEPLPVTPEPAVLPPRPRSHAAAWALLAVLGVAVAGVAAWVFVGGKSSPAVTTSQAVALPAASRPPAPTDATSVAAPAPSRAETPEPPSAPPGTLARGEYLSLPIEFDKNSADYTVADSAALEAMLARVKAALASNPRLRLEVGGHASGDGAEARNEHLGYGRASAIVTYLGTQGIEHHRIRVRSYGTSLPLVAGNGADPANRRVTLRLID